MILSPFEYMFKIQKAPVHEGTGAYIPAVPPKLVKNPLKALTQQTPNSTQHFKSGASWVVFNPPSLGNLSALDFPL
jgi:hypothetical protein